MALNELIFDTLLAPDAEALVWRSLPLPAEERVRARRIHETDDGITLRLALPRGTVMRQGDLLRASEDGRLLRVEAAPEPVLTVRAADAHELLRGAYHLGNRHVAVEVGPDYLRLSPDPVLKAMVLALGLHVIEELAPFEPEAGAYHGDGQPHAHGNGRVHVH